LRGIQLQRIEHHFDFARVAGQHFDLAGARHAGKRGTHDERRVVIEVRRREAASQTQNEHRKDGWGETFDRQLGIGR